MRWDSFALGERLQRRNRFLHTQDCAAVADAAKAQDAEDLVSVYLQDLLEDTREDLARADSKAALVLASSGVAVGALLAGLLQGGWSPLDLDASIQWIWWFGVCSAAVGIFSVSAAVYPRIYRRRAAGPELPTYYGDVASYKDVESFRLALGERPDLRKRLLDQTYLLSHTVQAKYKLLRRGLICFLIAAVACVSAVVINLVV